MMPMDTKAYAQGRTTWSSQVPLMQSQGHASGRPLSALLLRCIDRTVTGLLGDVIEVTETR